jgi:hypothetical protein
MRHFRAAFQQQTDLARSDARNVMNCRGYGCFTSYQSDPSFAVPVLKTIVPDATLRVVIRSADRLHQREGVEALLLCEIHFQPARGLAFVLNMPNRKSTNRCCRSRSGCPRRRDMRFASSAADAASRLLSIVAVAVWAANRRSSLLVVMFKVSLGGTRLLVSMGSRDTQLDFRTGIKRAPDDQLTTGEFGAFAHAL